jgi:hypothetical protein
MRQREIYITVLMLLWIACHFSMCMADPQEWPVGQGGNGHYYEAMPTTQGCTWNDAVAAAEAATWVGSQGYLATITSQEENDWIWATLDQPFQYRIGGLQPPGSPEPGGGWTWYNGEPWVYSNWAPGEPNNGGDLHDESTVEIHADGEWNDIHVDVLRPGYVVEFDAPPSPVQESTWGAIKGLFRPAE